MVNFFVNSIIPYPVRSYLLLGKKSRIYEACGVSQTPIIKEKVGEMKNEKNIIIRRIKVFVSDY